jgi:hypothetical protein
MDTRRFMTALGLTAATALVAVGLAAPAQAGAPGYVKAGSYGHGDQCLNIGQIGVNNHSWASYYCETVTPATWSAPGLYNLWVLY